MHNGQLSKHHRGQVGFSSEKPRCYQRSCWGSNFHSLNILCINIDIKLLVAWKLVKTIIFFTTPEAMSSVTFRLQTSTEGYNQLPTNKIIAMLIIDKHERNKETQPWQSRSIMHKHKIIHKLNRRKPMKFRRENVASNRYSYVAMPKQWPLTR